MKKRYNVITRHSIMMNNVFATSILFCQQKPWRGRVAEKWDYWKMGGKHQNTEVGERCCGAFHAGHRRELRGCCGRCTLARLWVSVILCCLHRFTPPLCPAWLLKTGWICHYRWVQWVMPCPAWFACVPTTTMFEKSLIDTHFTKLK